MHTNYFWSKPLFIKFCKESTTQTGILNINNNIELTNSSSDIFLSSIPSMGKKDHEKENREYNTASLGQGKTESTHWYPWNMLTTSKPIVHQFQWKG
jgi:hypothetical protein